MKRSFLSILAVGTVTIASLGDEPPLLPKGSPPTVMTAQADAKVAGQVVFMVPQQQIVTAKREVERDGKRIVEQSQVPVWISFSVLLKVDGKEVRAFGTDGKELKLAELSKRLANSASVVVFHQAEPDPYYLRVYREGTVVFTAPASKFLGPAGPNVAGR